MKRMIAGLALLLVAQVNADGHGSGLLDGASITYEYPELGTVRLSFEAGLLRYDWLKGPNEGESGSGHPYRARQVGDSVYLNWVEADSSSTITIFMNLPQGRMYTSGLIAPRSENEMVLWEMATIHEHSIDLDNASP